MSDMLYTAFCLFTAEICYGKLAWAMTLTYAGQERSHVPSGGKIRRDTWCRDCTTQSSERTPNRPPLNVGPSSRTLRRYRSRVGLTPSVCLDRVWGVASPLSQAMNMNRQISIGYERDMPASSTWVLSLYTVSQQTKGRMCHLKEWHMRRFGC